MDRLDRPNRTKDPPLRHCKCLLLLRPTASNVDLVCKELGDPRYGEYHLCTTTSCINLLDFTSFIKNALIERLAEADEFEVVKRVSEYYVDVAVWSPHSFSLNQPDPTNTTRTVEGLAAALLAIKRKPLIRVSRESHVALSIANQLNTIITDTHRQQFDLPKPDTAPVLLIVDRWHDLTSCLLTQWTLQAMLHQHFGITNNRITYNASDQMALQDPFYRHNLYTNYGDFNERLRSMVHDYEQQARLQHQLTDSATASVVDMKRFIHDYPEWRRKGELVGKWVAVAGHLEQIISNKGLLERSEVEQSMLGQEPTAGLQSLSRLLQLSQGDEDRMRSCLLYAAHFGPTLNRHSFMDTVKKHLHGEVVYRLEQALDIVLKHAKAPTAPDQQSVVTDHTVYTVHTSPLVGVVDKLLKGRLSLSDYPPLQPTTGTERPTDVIVFSCNGGSLQEQCQLHRLVQRQYPHVRLIYGCTDYLRDGTIMLPS